LDVLLDALGTGLARWEPEQGVMVGRPLIRRDAQPGADGAGVHGLLAWAVAHRPSHPNGTAGVFPVCKIADARRVCKGEGNRSRAPAAEQPEEPLAGGQFFPRNFSLSLRLNFLSPRLEQTIAAGGVVEDVISIPPPSSPRTADFTQKKETESMRLMRYVLSVAVALSLTLAAQAADEAQKAKNKAKGKKKGTTVAGTVVEVKKEKDKDEGTITVKIQAKKKKDATAPATPAEEKTFKVTTATKFEKVSGKKGEQ